jgi:PGF-pre-PGF domain-containing protein
MALLCKKNKLQFLTIAFFIILVLNGTAAATSVPSTLYVDAEGNGNYTTIQAAVNNSSSGDTILVYPGTYTENVNVSVANISILSYSGNPEDTIVKRLNVLSHNFKITANNVTISGFNITGAGSTGIYMSGFSGANITNNKLSGVGCGVQIESSSRCNLVNNTVTDSADHGFYLSSSSNCTLTNNTISDISDKGIYLQSSSNCTLANNTVSDTSFHGIYIYYSDNCTLDSNAVSNTPSYGILIESSPYCNLTSNTILNTDACSIYLHYSNYCTLDNNTVSNSYEDGIYLYYSSSCTLTSNTVSNADYYGIHLGSSSNCNLTDNAVSDTYYEGIYLFQLNGCTLANNTISNAEDGIHLYYSSDCNLTNNNISDTYDDGIYMYDSSGCNLFGNIISDSDYGLYMSESNGCNLSGNIISDSDYGLYIYSSDYCTLTNNTVSNADYGITLSYSIGTILRNNTASSGRYGLRLREIENCTLTDNTMSGNWYNFELDYDGEDIDLDNATGNIIDTSNLVDGKPIYYFERETNPSIGSDAGVVYCINCKNAEIENFVLQNNTCAILLYNTSSNMQNNTINNTEYGVMVLSSQDIRLSGSRFENSAAGIVFQEAVNATVTDNTVRNSIYGIVIAGSENCTLKGNSILNSTAIYSFLNSANSNLVKGEKNALIKENSLISPNLVQSVRSYGVGIYSMGSQNFSFENNIVDQASYRGIYLEDCQNGTLVRNSIRNIGDTGIYTEESSNVELLDNTVQNVTGETRLYDAGNSPLVSSSLVSGSRAYGCGIYLDYSQNIRLVRNSVRDIGCVGIYTGDSSGVELLDNTVQNVTGEYMLPAAGNFSLVSSPLVSRSRVSGYGIYFDYSEDIRLKGNTVKDSYQVWGIYLSEPVNATLESNTLTNCQGGLITVLSENFSVSDCSVTNCTSGGILIINPEEGTGTGYTVTGCTVDGSDIGLLVTGEGTLSGNTLSGNSYGLILYDVNNSQIYGNTMIQNSLAGIAIDPDESEIMARSGLVRSMESPASGNNTIYNNYFNNVNNTLINSEANNTWNISKIAGESIVGGPYLGGNYWANPNGTGFSENCTDADRDGISDSSYEIVNGTFDYLPLKIIPSTTTRHKSSANYIPSSGSSGVTGTDGAQKRVVAGTQTTFNFNNPVSGVLGLSFTSQQYSGNVIVRIEVLDGVSGEKPEGEVYQQMNILVGNERFESGSNINGASINFRVSKSWVEENNIDVSTIKINRFHGEEWNALVTEMTGEDEEFYYFTAETPGFSRYAVTGDKLGSEVITPAEEETGTVTGEEQTNDVKKSTPGFESTFAVFGILASVFFAKKRVLK